MQEQEYDYNDWDEVELEDEEEVLSPVASNVVLVCDLWRPDEINKPPQQVKLEQEALFKNKELKHLLGG